MFMSDHGQITPEHNHAHLYATSASDSHPSL